MGWNLLLENECCILNFAILLAISLLAITKWMWHISLVVSLYWFFGLPSLHVQRSSQLRRLHLISCVNFTYSGLIEVVKRLPLLEELHFHRIFISKEVIEAAGQCCPHLNSFKLILSRTKELRIRPDEEAQAVAENMPGLRHLQLIANTTTEKGLQAILDSW